MLISDCSTRILAYPNGERQSNAPTSTSRGGFVTQQGFATCFLRPSHTPQYEGKEFALTHPVRQLPVGELYLCNSSRLAPLGLAEKARALLSKLNSYFSPSPPSV